MLLSSCRAVCCGVRHMHVLYSLQRAAFWHRTLRRKRFGMVAMSSARMFDRALAAPWRQGARARPLVPALRAACCVLSKGSPHHHGRSTLITSRSVRAGIRVAGIATFRRMHCRHACACLQELFQDRGVQASVGMLAAAIAALYVYCTVFVTTI